MACSCGGSQKQFGLACAGGSACGCGRPRIARIVVTRVLTRMRRLPLAPLGELRGLIYRPRPAPGEPPRNYVHFFKRPPVLAADPAGRRLYIIGGQYRLTRRGIEG